VFVKGEIHTKLKLFCARCLEPFIHYLDTNVDFSLIPYSQSPQKEVLKLKSEEMEAEFFNGIEIDLAQIISEQIFLNVPIKALCQKDCAGLCPYCGTNLNKEKCKCINVKHNSLSKTLKNLKL
jgi:uncharacterized protein